MIFNSIFQPSFSSPLYQIIAQLPIVCFVILSPNLSAWTILIVMTCLFQPQQKLLFIGDSITDCGRRQQSHAPHGDGYVRHIAEQLSTVRRDLNLSIVNKGISGDTSRDLLRRWERDVTAERPDWLFIKVGVNDMWRYISHDLAAAVPVSEYESNLRQMLARSREATDAGIILIEPFLVEPDRADPFRAGLHAYQTAVCQLALEFDTRLVKLQDAFDRALASRPPAYWAEDRVHPTAAGHRLIADEILAVCGY